MAERWEGRLHIVGGEDREVLVYLWVEAGLSGGGVELVVSTGSVERGCSE